MSQPARKQSKDMQTYADIKHGTTNKSTRTIASMYSATFG